MNAIEFMKRYCPHILKSAQKLGLVGQAVFDAGRAYQMHFARHDETFEDGGGV